MFTKLPPNQQINRATDLRGFLSQAIAQAVTHGLLINNKASRHVETLFIQGRNFVPSRPAIGWWKVNKPHQPIADLLGTRFLPRTNKVSTCRKGLL